MQSIAAGGKEADEGNLSKTAWEGNKLPATVRMSGTGFSSTAEVMSRFFKMSVTAFVSFEETAILVRSDPDICRRVIQLIPNRQVGVFPICLL